MSSRTLKSTAFIATCAGVVCLALAAAARAEAGAKPPAPGEAVNGLKLTLAAEKTELKMRRYKSRHSALEEGVPEWSWDVERVNLTVTFTNVSDKPIKLNLYDLALSPGLELSVEGPDAQSVWPWDIGANKFRTLPNSTEKDFPVLAPGRSLTYSGLSQLSFPGPFGRMGYALMKPGEFRVKAIYSGHDRELTGRMPVPFEQGCWQGAVTSKEIVFTAATHSEAVNGLKLTVTADKTELKMTSREAAGKDEPRWNVEPAKLTFRFTNVSDKPIKLNAYCLNLVPDVQGPAAGSVRTRDWGPMAGAPRGPIEADYPVIEPGKSWEFVASFPGSFGTLEYSITQPGEYRFKATYSAIAPAQDHLLPRFQQGCWSGSVTSNEIVFTAVALEEPVNGLKLTLSADKTNLKMMPREAAAAEKDDPRWNVESVKVTVTFTNVSDKPIKIDLYDLGWNDYKGNLLELTVNGPDARSVLARDIGAVIDRQRALPNPKDFPTLTPGATFAVTLGVFPGRFGHMDYTLLKPGEYRVRATYSGFVRALLRGMSEFEMGTWVGTVKSNEVVFKASEK